MMHDSSLSKTSNNRYEIIDLLRGIAILLVVIRHVQLRIPFEKTYLFSNLPDQIFSAVFISGSQGVLIFFVISGFIITMTSLNRNPNLNKINITEFYSFRFARIAPCLIALLTILTALHYLNVKDYVINSKFSYSEALLSALTFHLNWLEGSKGYLPGSWDVLWSLSVEEVFYLAFPLVCFISRRKEVLYIALVSLIVIGPFYRVSLEGNHIWQSKAYLSCMDSIAIGCLCALLSHKRTIPTSTLKAFSIIGTVLIVFVLMAKRDPSFSVFNEISMFNTTISIGVGLLLVSSVRKTLSPAIQILLRPLIAYGRLSYEVYLTHMFVVYSAVRLYKKYQVSLDNAVACLIAILFVSAILGYIVERFFSKPMNVWIRERYREKTASIAKHNNG